MRISVASALDLLDGSRVRPGMTKVSRDERLRLLGSCPTSDFLLDGPNESRLFDFCILMPVCMLHDES